MSGIDSLMTLDLIFDNASMAETWPESKTLNFGEVGWYAISEWVKWQVEAGDEGILLCDVESVKSCFERWWKDRRYPATPLTPAPARQPATPAECSPERQTG